MADWTRSFANMVQDVRQRVLEEGWFGKAVTPRSQTITLGQTGEQSPAEALGWVRPDQNPHEHDRDAAKTPNDPDRGIDL